MVPLRSGPRSVTCRRFVGTPQQGKRSLTRHSSPLVRACLVLEQTTGSILQVLDPGARVSTHGLSGAVWAFGSPEATIRGQMN